MRSTPLPVLDGRGQQGSEPERRLSDRAGCTGEKITEPWQDLRMTRAGVQAAKLSSNGRAQKDGIRSEREQLPLAVFRKPFLKQGFNADQTLGILTDAFIDCVDAVTVGADLNPNLANIALDPADADGEQTEPGESGPDQD